MVSAVGIGSSGCIASRGGAFVAPAQYDVSPVVMAQPQQSSTGMQVKGGLSWASISSSPRTNVDVRVGYLGEAHRRVVRARSSGPTPLSYEPPASPSPNRFWIHGPFFELSSRISGSRHRRAWLGARAEMLLGDELGAGAAVRSAVELFHASKGSNHHGALGLGLFFEVGARHLPGGRGAVFTAAGFTTRLPAVILD